MKKLISKGKVLTLLLGVGFALNVSSAENSNVLIQGEAAQDGDTKPRTLEGYVHQEDAFFKYLKEHHPMFKYEKEGRIVGKYAISDREEEYVEFSNGPTFAQQKQSSSYFSDLSFRNGIFFRFSK